MPTLTQTVAGAAQFDGNTATTGLFSFAEFDLLPNTTRIVVNRIAYHSAVPGGGGSGGTSVTALYQNLSPGAQPTEIILLGRGLAPSITSPDGSADYGICGGEVPRKPGMPSPGSTAADHWTLRVISAGKTVSATVSVDYDIVANPQSSPLDPVVGP